MSGLDLYQTQRALALLFVYAACAGLGLGAVYDALRFLRILCGEAIGKQNAPAEGQGSRSMLCGIIRFSADLLFSVIAAVTLILLCYYASDGSLRAPALGGMAGGFFVYVQTLGRLTLPAEYALTRFFKAMLRPLRRAASRAISLVGRLRQRQAEKSRERKQKIQTHQAAKALIASARRGFDGLARDASSPDKGDGSLE